MNARGSDPLRPVGPDVAWDDAAAAHLLRRTGFRPSIEERERALALGRTAAIDAVLAPSEERESAAEIDALGATVAAGGESSALRGWWLMRLARTSRTLDARLALLWHDHFATSLAKVDDARLMLGQLRTFEAHARGPFGDLLRAIARDPAMIRWLDGNRNVNGRPNENFARELFELFALGLGAYTEADVREAARAFTGWHERDGRFRFARLVHDRGTKRVLGRDVEDGDDVIDAVLAHPACARFLADRLLRTFLGPESAPGADREVREALAAHLRGNAYDVGASIDVLLRSAAFHDPMRRRTRIVPPVEFTVGLVRSLELPPRAPELRAATDAMGQRLFEPPSVEGWPEGRGWIDTTSMLARLSFARGCSSSGELPVASLCERVGARDGAAAVALAGRLAFDGDPPAGLRPRLASIATEHAGDPARALRSALDVLLVHPSYQLA